ncbi:MAG: HU family DNA-binding protein [Myxococcales bacterium]|nr:HU family DNA-binding protein [Myxococcales bacterium]
MNKAELVSHVAKDGDMTKAQAAQALDSFVKVITDALGKGDKVTILGFGTFTTSERSARPGRNPKTGEEIQIPAKRVAKFKPGKELADSLN